MLNRPVILFFVFMSLFVCPVASAADNWAYEIELYAMGTAIEGDAGLGCIDNVDVDITFSDILEDLQMAGMARFEAVHKSGWGLALDYGFMKLKDDVNGPVGGVHTLKIRQGILQADLVYRIPKEKFTMDLIAGTRWWDNDLDVTMRSGIGQGFINQSKQKDWIDLFLGVKTYIPFTEKWSAAFRFDIGGLDIESDFTATLSGYIRYCLTKNWMMSFGYKALWVDYEDGDKGQSDYFSYDTVTHGPVIGIIYRF